MIKREKIRSGIFKIASLYHCRYYYLNDMFCVREIYYTKNYSLFYSENRDIIDHLNEI